MIILSNFCQLGPPFKNPYYKGIALLYLHTACVDEQGFVFLYYHLCFTSHLAYTETSLICQYDPEGCCIGPIQTSH